MKILALDTSSKFFSLALSMDKKILAQTNRKLKKFEHNRLLLKEIERLLNKCNLTINDIDVVSVGRGPGSFTGLRIGLAAAKGLVFESKRRLMGISSFDAVALNIKESKRLIVVIEDARKQMVYGCSYLYNDTGKLERISDYQLQSLEDFCTYIHKLSKKYKKDVIFTKDGINPYKEELQNAFKTAVFADEKKWFPKAANIAALTFENWKLNKKMKSKDVEIEPLYLHSQYANISKPKKI